MTGSTESDFLLDVQKAPVNRFVDFASVQASHQDSGTKDTDYAGPTFHAAQLVDRRVYYPPVRLWRRMVGENFPVPTCAASGFIWWGWSTSLKCVYCEIEIVHYTFETRDIRAIHAGVSPKCPNIVGFDDTAITTVAEWQKEWKSGRPDYIPVITGDAHNAPAFLAHRVARPTNYFRVKENTTQTETVHTATASSQTRRRGRRTK